MTTESKQILLLDDDAEVRRTVENALRRLGYALLTEGTGRGIEALAEREVDAVLAGIDDPASTAAFVRRVKRAAGRAPVLALCDPQSLGDGVEALRAGADDYLGRPPDIYELRARLQRALERHELDSRIAYFQGELAKRGRSRLEAHSAPMRRLVERIARVGPRRSTVLIYGESGVGKELVARAIHFNSPRRDQSFMALNCAAIPPGLIESELFGHEKGAFTDAGARVRGKFEIAHRGTIFLDEIGEMDPATQAKLLRVLEEREFMRVGGDRTIRVDVRVLAATNADLEGMVASHAFREDLYYRLKVVTLDVPPLRERRDDIPHLVRVFLEQLSRENAMTPRRLTPAALEALCAHDWPGNVRELKNVLESLLVSAAGDTIDVDELPAAIRGAPDRSEDPLTEPGTTMAEMERELIRRTLIHTGGNRTHAADMLGIGVRTLQRKVAGYGLAIPSRRRRRLSGD